MKYSYNWLTELSGTKLSPEKLRNLLMLRSFEVEGLEKTGQGLEGVVIGKILEIAKHPNADKLQLTKVDVGNAVLDIVCGAKNIEVGQKVPVAMVGAKLPNGIEIKAAEIRGEKSSGMLCAKDELGLGEDHAGIFILDKDAKIGMALAKFLELDDVILDIDILPNRAHDCLGYVGVAYEITAIENRGFDYDYSGLKLPKVKSKKLKVEVADKELCPRYIGAVMENIEVKESPQWMQAKLSASGIRPINNIVDATNFVMLELGQPMHAFDFEKVSGMKSKIPNYKSQINPKSQIQTCNIIVRRAKEGEEIKLLDDEVKKLDKDNLVIANNKEVLAIAGVMGGLNSGVNPETQTIILESASFNAVSVRKTRVGLGLKTDASDRFEKDIDPNLAEKAMVRAVEIIEHIAGGKLEGIADIYPKKVKPWKIKLDLEYANKLLGENIPFKRSIQILKSLGMDISGKDGKLTVGIPTYRVDIKTQEDLIEEIGRIFGYENIKSQPMVAPLVPAKVNKERFFERNVKNTLAGLGFDEVYNYSFYGQKDANDCALGEIKHLELANPMNPGQQLMRVSLIPNILKNVRDNLRNFKSFNIFESGRVYWPDGEILPEERKMVVMAVVLEHDKSAETFFAAKGAASDLSDKLGIKNVYFDNFDAAPSDSLLGLWHPGRSAEIKVEGMDGKIGYIGEINPLILPLFKINRRVAMVELDLEKSMEAADVELKFEAIRKYPTVLRDISILVGREITVGGIIKNIKKSGAGLVVGVELFDVFCKEEKNSFAFHIELGAIDHTLESSEIDAVMAKIISGLEKELGAEIRK
ncbi:MAG: phenylalanine--tRNA ligase subunit beta [Candidatus Moranbacteria bacterium]|nr:phenylalanine--tRNA ligase subunit beta [Candidatus Moranbacteria bacterium]